MEKFDVVIIGAGPAGSVAGASLLQDGLNVLILEKAVFPRFVIGESLLPHAMDYLEKVDLLTCLEKEKFQIKTGVTFYHQDEICAFSFKERYTPGWDYTYQVKRADFDHALIREVELKGACVRFNAEVIDVKTSKTIQFIKYIDDNGDEIELEAKFVIDASGYGRVLPKMFNLEKPAVSIPRGSIFAHITDEGRKEAAEDNIFVHAFNDNSSWIWSIPFSDKTSSVGIVGGVDFINSCAEDYGALFKNTVKTFPGLEERYTRSSFLFEPRKLLNYSISVKKMYGEGFVLCGNSTEFLDPIFSSGVTLAVSSGYKAAKLVKETLDGKEVDWEEEYVDFMQHGINVFRSYVDAWYNGDLQTIFFKKNGNDDFKRQICSVLAGYVWDRSNPFVKKHNTVLSTLSKVIAMR